MANTHGSAVLLTRGNDVLDFPQLKDNGISEFIMATNGLEPPPDPMPEQPIYDPPKFIIPMVSPSVAATPNTPPPSPSIWTPAKIAAVPIGGFGALLLLWYLVDSSIIGRLVFGLPLVAIAAWLWMRKPGSSTTTQPASSRVTASTAVPAEPGSPEYSAALDRWNAADKKYFQEGMARVAEFLKKTRDTLGFGVTWAPRKLKGMAVSFGAARSGKGTSTIIPVLLSFAGSVVALDIKAELAAICAQRRRDLGQNAVILDPFGEVNRAYGEPGGWTETITRYNPLADLDPTAITFADDLAATGEAICLADRVRGDNSFFAGAASALVVGLIAAVVQRRPGRGTLREVREFLTMDNQEFAAACIGICDDFPGSQAARKLASFKIVSKLNDNVRATAAQVTDFLDSEELLQAMEPGPDEPKFSFSSLTAKGGSGTSVFIVCPPTHLYTHKPWLRLLIMQSLRHCIRVRNTGPNPLLFLLDEAGTSLGHLSVIENAYGQLAGLGILLWSFYQDIGQLRRDYSESWETFIGNSIMVQVIAARDQATCDYFSKYMGNFTDQATTESTSTNQGQSSGTSLGGSPGSSSISDGKSQGTSTSISTGPISRPIKNPDEIRNMDPRTLLIFFPGVAQYQLFKQVYYTDPRYAGLFRPDPTYPLPEPVLEAQLA